VLALVLEMVPVLALVLEMVLVLHKPPSRGALLILKPSKCFPLKLLISCFSFKSS